MNELTGIKTQTVSAMWSGKAVRALMPMPCTGVGVGRTCQSILAAAGAAGIRTDLCTSRHEGDMQTGLHLHTGTPRLLHWLPNRLAHSMFGQKTCDEFMSRLDENDVAYLWPSTPLPVYERLAERGTSIVAEAINSRMAVARRILDNAYERLGQKPAHGITDARIADQEARYSLCDAIFSPSPATDRSFAGTPLENLCIGSEYGTWVPDMPQTRPAETARPVTILFLGSVCVRKGAHLLLEAWRNAPKGAVLRLVGELEPVIRDLFADVLNRETVICRGFRANVAAEIADADIGILPSLEEGDPIATYEIAAQGLPMIASETGAGRIGADTGAIRLIDPADIDMLRATLEEFVASDELRRHWGDIARKAATGYDWSIVAPRRFRKLHEFLEL